MRLPFTEEQWAAARRAGITNESWYTEEDILDDILVRLEDCVLLNLNGKKALYQEMVDIINRMFED